MSKPILSPAASRRFPRWRACAAVLAAAAIGLLAVTATPTSVQAHDYKVGTIKIDHPWTRVTPPGAKVAGGFMTLTNTGSETDRLVGGTFALSERIEIHEMKVDSGLMTMKELKDGLEIAPGATVTLRPGSYHAMFMGLSSSPKLDESVAGTLVFEKAGRIDVMYAVAPLGAKTSDAKTADHSGHDHSDHDHSAHKHDDAAGKKHDNHKAGHHGH